MPNTISEYRCLLISPTDVLREREALTHYINRWNAMIGSVLSVRVDLVRWESHVTPDLSGPPQDVINSQIVNNSDLGIAIFWSKVGTPTTEYESGSVEEIYQLLQRQARVMVYFCERPIPQANIKSEQFLKLLALKEKLNVIGLFAEYTEISDLCEKVGLHLTNAITKLLERDKPVVVGISKSPREQIEELESAIINSSEPSITDSSVQNLARYLLSKEIGVSRAAVRAMIALVDRNALPISVLALAKSTKICWEIRRNVVDRVRKESPDIALPLLNEFASSGFHTIQTHIRDYLRDIIDDESSVCELLKDCQDVLAKMNLANTATEETIKKNSKLIARVTDLMVRRGCNSESKDEIGTRYQTNTDLSEILDIAISLQNTMLAQARGTQGSAAKNNGFYKELRERLLLVEDIKTRLPRLIRTCRELPQFWSAIKSAYPSYAEREKYIREEFTSLLDFLESESLKKKVQVGFIDEVDLQNKMSQAFDLSEVKQLFFYLQIDFEDIPGDKKSDKIREAIAFLRRRDRLYELVNACRKYRKNIIW